jgi:hypothetical protein
MKKIAFVTGMTQGIRFDFGRGRLQLADAQSLGNHGEG